MSANETRRGGTLAVIIPAYNAASTLNRCLAAITSSARRPDEVILFDDGSTDETPAIARSYGVRVLTNEGSPLGPAVGRNRAARASSCDIVVFIDADVIIHNDTLGLLEEAIVSDPSVAAAFGSYDRSPPATRLSAFYINLRHHYFHQNSGTEAVTFWSGIGAVRRDAFLAVGGFDERYALPSIEDIHLGGSLRSRGAHIRVVPQAQGAHCKDWTLIQAWETDIFKRAIPWAIVMASGYGEKGGLNASKREQILAALAHSVWIFGACAFFNIWFGAAALVSAFAYFWANRSFLKLLADVGGARLAISGALLHWCYHLYASVIYGTILMASRLGLTLEEPYKTASARNAS